MYIRRLLFIIRRVFASIRMFLRKYFKDFFQFSALEVLKAVKYKRDFLSVSPLGAVGRGS